MDELVALLGEHPEVRFGLEAAVCGGIPIISLLQNGLLPDSVQQLAGIMNGTTNFILSKMESEGADYGVASVPPAQRSLFSLSLSLSRPTHIQALCMAHSIGADTLQSSGLSSPRDPETWPPLHDDVAHGSDS